MALTRFHLDLYDLLTLSAYLGVTAHGKRPRDRLQGRYALGNRNPSGVVVFVVFILFTSVASDREICMSHRRAEVIRICICIHIIIYIYIYLYIYIVLFWWSLFIPSMDRDLDEVFLQQRLHNNDYSLSVAILPVISVLSPHLDTNDSLRLNPVRYLPLR